MDSDDILAILLGQCRHAHHAWLNGDARGYAFTSDTDTIMGPFGGRTTGSATTTPGQQRVAAHFESGSGEIEFIRGAVSGDLAYLVLIERAKVRFAGHTAPQRWNLRATEVFQHTDGAWRRSHRLADSLVDYRGFDEVLALWW